ncbi:MAG: class I SAM-dependent methyltransferase [Rickettsiaceae bacterium]|nr:class I SAM-dependent methyltransferase [Rickettsiaceae bacterium]
MNKVMKTIFIFLVFLQGIYVNANDISQKFNTINQLNYGVQATNTKLDDIEKLLPDIPVSKTGKSFLTVNKTGFDVLDTENQANWVLDAYSKFISRNIPQTILDIGSGYGTISRMALKHNKVVIANDIAAEHLIYARKITKSQGLDLKNLYLNNSYFPSKIKVENDTLDAVVLYRVIHFLSPQEIEFGLSEIYKWLKRGGQVFIVVLSPQHKEYSDWFLPIYNAKWHSGNKWPGEGLEVSKALPKQQYNLPKYLHVMDDRPLQYALEKSGFTILKKGFIDMSRFNSSDNSKKRDGKESFGIIAVKN